MGESNRSPPSRRSAWLTSVPSLGLCLLALGLARCVAAPGAAGWGTWLRLALLGLAGLALVLAALLVVQRRIVRRTLSPLRGLTETAREISPSNLRRRFRVVGDGREVRLLEQE